MDSVSALDFARLARSLAEEARAAGWVVPAFRSPPGLAGATRTVRRQHGAGVVVAVRRAGRTREQVTADLIEGIIVANEWSNRR